MATLVYQQTWDVDTGSPDGSANMTRDTTTKHDGAGAVKLICATDVAYWLKNASAQVMVAHVWARFHTLPNVTTADLLGVWVPTIGFFGLGFDQPTGKMYCEIGPAGAGTPAGPVLVVDTWYEFDVKVKADVASPTVDGRVNGTALGQNSTTGGPYTFDSYRLGEFQTSQTYELYYDTLDVSHTAADYPLTYGQTILPDADVAAGGWATAPLYSKLNDASDATIITATAA